MSELSQGITFKIACRQLLAGLKKVSGVIENAQVMQILSCVKVRLSGSVLMLLASDSDIEITAEIHDNDFDVKEAFDFAVPGRKLFDICRALPVDAELKFEVDDQWLHIRSGQSRFKLMLMSAKEFPVLGFEDVKHRLVFSEAQLQQCLAQTHFAMAVHDVRQFLNGMLFDCADETLRLVATDGHRLSVADLPYATKDVFRKIVPRKAIVELMKLLNAVDSEVLIELTEQKVRFTTHAGQLVSGLIQGDYPDYTRLLPSSQSHAVSLAVADFKAALVRASILSHDRFKAATFNFKDKVLCIESENAQHEKINETVDLLTGELTLSIAFNILYVLDVLNAVGDSGIVFEASLGHKAVTLKPASGDAVVHVVMPLTL